MNNFYPRPPRGGRRTVISNNDLDEQFLSTPSARRATQGGQNAFQSKTFLSTPSARRATNVSSSELVPVAYFYPRPPRGGRQSSLSLRLHNLSISIHALREEGDRRSRKRGERMDISIHALREEGDKQSDRAGLSWLYFYPRPPRGGRLSPVNIVTGIFPVISIHALREEGDAADIRVRGVPCNFYPRPPRGGRRRRYPREGCTLQISIHALREEGDRRRHKARRTRRISIHALREEGDLSFPVHFLRCRYFYPRPPRGGRH